MPRPIQGCGTNGGYQRHLKDGEEPCRDCKKAKADYQRRYRYTHPDQYADERRTQAARLRAHARLAQQHSEDFEALFLEELRKDRPGGLVTATPSPGGDLSG